MATKQKRNDRPKLSGLKFVTPRFRLSFPHIFEPHAFDDKAEPKYSIVMLVEKDSTEFTELRKKLRSAAAEAWGKDPKKWPKIEWPWRDGDASEDLSGYAGMYAISADSQDPPGVVNRDREDVVNQRDVYAGGFARAEVVAKAVPNVAKKNFVKFYLQHVWFLGGGEKFGPGGNAKDAFANIDEDFEDDGGDSDNDDMEFDDSEMDLGF